MTLQAIDFPAFRAQLFPHRTVAFTTGNMREEILPPELRHRRADFDGLGDLTHDADGPEVPMVRTRADLLMDFPGLVVMDSEDLQRTLVVFRRVAHQRDKARQHEILKLVALVLLVLVTLFKFLWPFVSGQSG